MRGGRLLGALFLMLAMAATASAQTRWSDPATWGGQVPGPGAHVVVPQARRIVLDVSPPPLASITVDGVLAFGDRDIDLTVGWIMVHGMLEIGTEQVPYPHRATITLTGPLDEDVMGMGARFIGSMQGGALEIHGSRRADVDWAVLAAPARPGDTTISLALIEPDKGVLGWRPGDLLAIAPSGRDPLQAEAVTVTAVSGTRVSFTPPLQFHHVGQVQMAQGRTIDERAEVGLLSRNIVIQGAPDGFGRNLGGHVMVMAGSIGKIEGVELRHMGQMGRMGRYPIHWHLTGYAPDDYARFNSIWNSFQRAVAVHGTEGVEVRGNVAANVYSHTYVVGENGSETGNVFEDNLGILTRRAPADRYAFAGPDAPGADGPAAQDEWRPATFWINNVHNVVRGNRAAGGLDAIGFFFDNDHGRMAPADGLRVDFRGNVAHSYLASDPDNRDPRDVSGLGLLVRMAPRPGAHRVFTSFTAYQNSVAGAWLEDASDVLQASVLADNASGAIVFRGAVEDALIAGQTANRLTTHPPSTVRGGIQVPGHVGGPKAPTVRRTTFVNQRPSAVFVESDSLMPGNLFEDIVRVDTPVPVFLRDRAADHTWEGGLLDVDGSLTGAGAPAVVTGVPIGPDSAFEPGWGSFAPGGAYLTPQPALAASAPSGLTSSVERSTVNLAWYPPADPSGIQGYLVEAGSAPGRADLAAIALGPVTAQAFGSIASGQYFVRVRGLGPGGPTPASNEIRIVVGGPACDTPDPPTRFQFSVAAPIVSLAWRAAAGASRYFIVAGSVPGGADQAVIEVPAGVTAVSGAVPPGAYYGRIVAQNACGISVPSNERLIVVP